MPKSRAVAWCIQLSIVGLCLWQVAQARPPRTEERRYPTVSTGSEISLDRPARPAPFP